MYVPFNIVTYYSETNGRTKLLMIADRNGFASGWRGVGFTFWNGKQGKKKKKHNKKLFSFSPNPKSASNACVSFLCQRLISLLTKAKCFLLELFTPPPPRKENIRSIGRNKQKIVKDTFLHMFFFLKCSSYIKKIRSDLILLDLLFFLYMNLMVWA